MFILSKLIQIVEMINYSSYDINVIVLMKFSRTDIVNVSGNTARTYIFLVGLCVNMKLIHKENLCIEEDVMASVFKLM